MTIKPRALWIAIKGRNVEGSACLMKPVIIHN